jgi:hypothetical protein
MPRLSKIGAAALAAFGWTSGTSAVTASYLVVAGGGGGGCPSGGGGGGGGAGGFRTATASLNPTLSYTVTVGAGGVGAGAGSSANGSIGSSSIFDVTTSTGGGFGAGYTTGSAGNGGSGGSGGGSAGNNPTTGGGAGNTPSTSPSQGNNGGGAGSIANGTGGGGGGGAGASGSTATTSAGANGGNGTANSITGSSVTYAGGGGGGADVRGSSTVGTGGTGGGGNGGGSSSAVSGTANLGGGGGGGQTNGSGNGQVGGNGGSGVVIISYAGAQQFSGGIVTSVGGNTIHTFTTSGTLGPITTLSASYLIVAGGAGGGYTQGGGGGAGGLLSGSGVTIDPNSTYLVTVGAGGAGGTSGSVNAIAGSNSSFSMVTTTAVGGGYGASNNYPTATTGGSGGSGGGGANGSTGGGGSPSGTGGAGTVGQGNNGGFGYVGSGNSFGAGGGGGGAGAVGADASPAQAGNGGAGVSSSISGTSTFYAGGGGGGGDNRGPTGGTGGSGGGGSGSITTGTAGTANTGGGGGGSGYNAGAFFAGASGGSGVVIISYPGATQQMAGGTVTIVGGNVIHTFTSTGYLAPIELSTGSLRFRSSNSGYLSRTPAVTSNRTTWTWSAWVKRSSTASGFLFYAGNGSSQDTSIYFTNSQLQMEYYNGGPNYYLRTTAVYRDPAAWYHFTVVWDSTQTTSSNRIQIYVNGVRVTSFSAEVQPTQNLNGFVNDSSYSHSVGSRNAASYFDGEITEVNFIDGQALAPTSFGTFNSYGVWQPITYGGSYGTNGFYLPFNRQAVSFVGLFNGSNQYLSIASNSVFNQSGDFTIEYYANLTSNTNYQVVVGRGTGFITIQHSSDSGAMIRLVRYGQLIIATGGNVTAGKWNHFAIVRSGSTVTGYVNGIAVASGTDSTSTATGNALAIAQNSDGTNYFTGSISNVRYTNTAVYTSNFIPSTSALTAVTGTQLLTLQNSSIVDNSTNALSITNNNGVSTGQTYPFAYGIFNDQGPAGNNWTPTNISGAFGSTLDYLGDAPTLTSATVANYCVINPLDKGTNATVSNGNLTLNNAYTGAPYPSARGSIGVSSGKWYWEITCTTLSGNSPSVGVGTAQGDIQNYTGYDAYSWGYILFTGQKGNNNNTAQPYGASVSSGDVVGVALDMDAGTVTFYKNGTSQGVAFTGLTGTMFPWNFAFNNSVMNLNFGQQPFLYTPPSNHLALNTFNL